MERNLTCIVCPNGCTLKVEYSKSSEGKVSVLSVTGNMCPKGHTYAAQEIEAPMRTIASSVSVEGGVLPLVSVRTSSSIPKDRIFDVMGEIRKAKVKAPVCAGQIIIKDVLGLGSNIIATKNVELL